MRDLVGEGSALVILGSRAGRHDTFRAFESYSPLVPVGSAVVVTDTIVNGHPVWPGFGPGPAEGVKQILTRHGDFQDRRLGGPGLDDGYFDGSGRKWQHSTIGRTVPTIHDVVRTTA